MFQLCGIFACFYPKQERNQVSSLIVNSPVLTRHWSCACFFTPVTSPTLPSSGTSTTSGPPGNVHPCFLLKCSLVGKRIVVEGEKKLYTICSAVWTVLLAALGNLATRSSADQEITIHDSDTLLLSPCPLQTVHYLKSPEKNHEISVSG